MFRWVAASAGATLCCVKDVGSLRSDVPSGGEPRPSKQQHRDNSGPLKGGRFWTPSFFLCVCFSEVAIVAKSHELRECLRRVLEVWEEAVFGQPFVLCSVEKKIQFNSWRLWEALIWRGADIYRVHSEFVLR